MADARLSYLIDAKDRASATFKKVGGSARDTKKDLDSTSDGAKRLSRAIDDTKKSLDGLHKKFNETGDPKLLKDIRKGERDLKNMQGWAKRFAPEVKESSSAVAKLGRSLSNFPVLAPAVAVGGLALIPAAAAVAGVALAGVGLGFVGLGAMAVKNSKQVNAAFHDLSDTAVKEFTRAGGAMEKPIAGALRILRGTVKAVGPDLNDIFTSLAPHVDNVAFGIDGLIRNTMPGLKRAMAEAGAVLDPFSAKLAETGTALSSFFDSLADGSEGAGKALAATMGLINTQIALLGEGLEAGSKGFKFFTDGAGKWVGGIGAAYADHLSKTDKVQQRAAESAATAAEKTKAFGEAQATATAEFEKGTHVLAEYSKNLEIASGSQIGLSRAADDVIQSRKDLTQAVKDNGTALVGNSEKAMANREALRQGVEKANAFATALEASGKSQGFAAAQRQKDIDALRAWAIKQGMSTKEVDNFLASVNKVPPVKLTKMGTPGSDAAFLALARHNAEAARVPRQKNTTLRANVHYGSADAAARWRGAGPSSHRSTTLTLNVRYGSADAAARWRAGATGGLVGGLKGRKNAFAGGGIVAGGGTTTSDSVPIWASKKEFVTKASSVASIGVKNYEYMNRTGKLPNGGGGRSTVSARPLVIRGSALLQLLVDEIAGEVRRQGGQLGVLGLRA